MLVLIIITMIIILANCGSPLLHRKARCFCKTNVLQPEENASRPTHLNKHQVLVSIACAASTHESSTKRYWCSAPKLPCSREAQSCSDKHERGSVHLGDSVKAVHKYVYFE